MKIIIESIPHAEQRYPTSGDWQFKRGDLHVCVSETGDDRITALIGIHEAIEAIICRENAITSALVDEFDMRFEQVREIKQRGERFRPYDHLNEAIAADLDRNIDAEPGDCHAAPYYVPHQLATSVERMMAAVIDFPWNEYEERILALDRKDDVEAGEV